MTYCLAGTHNFEPRYDEETISDDLFKTAAGRSESLADMKEILFRKVYVKDVCIWCGEEIKK